MAKDEEKKEESKIKKKRPIRKKREKKENKEKIVQEHSENAKLEEKAEVIKSKPKKNKNKYSFGTLEVVIVMITMTLFGLFLGSYVTYKKYNTKDSEENSIKENEEQLKEIYRTIVDEYYGDVDQEKIFDNAIKAMVENLEDPYAFFLDENAALDLDEELSGTFIGLGIEVTNASEDFNTVVTVYKDSPASKAGILPGDKIIGMDSKNYSVDEMQDLIYAIKASKKGTKKVFTILRDNEERTIEVELGEVEVDSVSTYTVDKNDKKVGVITICNFASNTAEQFLAKYEELKKEGIDAMVIDLRGNSGGYLSSATAVSSLFLDKGAILYKKTDGKVTQDIINENNKKIDLPVVLLVNECTASSAEVFASSLNENIGTDIVGMETYGKGLIQKLIPINGGKYIKFSTQEWLTSKGEKVEGAGIKPTVEIDWDENSQYDVQLDKAIDTVLSK